MYQSDDDLQEYMEERTKKWEEDLTRAAKDMTTILFVEALVVLAVFIAMLLVISKYGGAL